ncbi:MAG: penicillin-binding protein 2, partial [Candidatus Dormibacteraeota bacterium]|nr:penicillin-binding protein 2 [Candidatus Dormibacteraeota bacterium]
MAGRTASPRRPAAPRRRRPADLDRHQGSSPDPGRRLGWLLVIMVVAVMGLGGRLVLLQISQGSQLAAAAVAQQVSQVTIPAVRGEILDDQGQA